MLDSQNTLVRWCSLTGKMSLPQSWPREQDSGDDEQFQAGTSLILAIIFGLLSGGLLLACCCYCCCCSKRKGTKKSRSKEANCLCLLICLPFLPIIWLYYLYHGYRRTVTRKLTSFCTVRRPESNRVRQ